MNAKNRNGDDDVIVISGVLLLVAVVFLIIGLFGSLGWVYASIGVSVASFLFLLVGVRQRRESPATSPVTPAPGLPSSAAGVGGTEPAAAAPLAATFTSPPESQPADDDVDDDEVTLVPSATPAEPSPGALTAGA